MKMKVILLLAIAIAAALVTQPVRATAIQTLVITENSSTSLTAMLTVGGTTTSLGVTPAISDNWTVALGGVSGAFPGTEADQFWTEPAAGFVNSVSFINQVPGRLFVDSDIFHGQSGLADGTPDTTTFTLNGGPLTVTFFDKGDVATTPDTGSTLGLLSLSVVALLGATRLRFLQQAA